MARTSIGIPVISARPKTRFFQFRPRPRNEGESEDEDENDDEEDSISAISGQALIIGQKSLARAGFNLFHASDHLKNAGWGISRCHRTWYV